jgi:uncharacterized protein (DUF488 family)
VKDTLRDRASQDHETDLTIWTVGHSTRSIDEFVHILASQNIQTLIDVRTFPGSRLHPQFNKEQLKASLSNIEVDYHHLPSLGGRRDAKRDSRNTAWRNASFRGYADHMESEEFQKGIAQLLEFARQKRTVFMCAESLWWRCHRGLISDYLKVQGYRVVHLIDEKHTEDHPYTTAARIIDERLSYEGLLP